MQAPDIATRLREAFPPAVREEIVDALHVAYADAGNRFDRSIGCVGLNFGVDVYTFACFQLKRRAEEMGAAVISTNPSFRLRFGEFEVGCYRVGESEADPIVRSFPHSAHAGRTLVEQQLWLFGAPSGPSHARGVVIAHQGSQEAGLRGVFLCVADSVNEDDRINHWHHCEPLWQAATDISDEPKVEVSLPPVEEVAVPVVRRKRPTGTNS